MICCICKEEKDLVYGSPCCRQCEDDVWEAQLEQAAIKLSYRSPLSFRELSNLSESQRKMAMEMPDKFRQKDHE